MKTYGTLALSNSQWSMSGVPPHVSIRLKQLFPRIPKHAVPPYTFPADPTHAADLQWFMQRYPLDMSSKDREWLTYSGDLFTQLQTDREKIFARDYKPPKFAGLKKGAKVRTYQAQAVDLLMRSGGLLLGDEVGLGKTFTSAAACLAPDALPAIIVCQPHLQRQWARVLREFTTLRVCVIDKTKPYALPKADVFIFRYTQLLGWVDVFEQIQPRLVVYDEVQELRRGEESAKGSAARRLSELATYRMGLSATPIYNYGVEIFNIMQFIRRDVLGDRHDFIREWAPFGSVKDPAALGSFLRDQHAFLRRTKRDVGQEVPPVNKIVDTVAYDQKSADSIEHLARTLAIRATTGTFIQRGQAARELDLLVRQATGVGKAASVADIARILVEGGEPIVLVGWHREVYDIWNKRLADLKPAMYTGSETAAGKDREKQRFLSGETDILIMSLRSGAGLDGLQARCSTMVFGELDWSPGVHHQCIGRLDREGQASPVTAIFLVADEGSDPPMMDVLGLKASEAAAIMDPTLGVHTTHSDESHLRKLIERYLDRKARKEFKQNEPPPVDKPEHKKGDVVDLEEILAAQSAAAETPRQRVTRARKQAKVAAR